MSIYEYRPVLFFFVIVAACFGAVMGSFLNCAAFRIVRGESFLRGHSRCPACSHELTALADTLKGVKNLNVDVSETGGNIVFLHKIVEGSASRSYGIHVAKLAGVPKEVLESAQAKLDSLESGEPSIAAPAEPAKPTKKKETAPEAQLSLFTPVDSELANMVRNLDLMNITPSQAIGILEELQEKARQ